jgi:hypothetical protein
MTAPIPAPHERTARQVERQQHDIDDDSEPESPARWSRVV